jgi:hypothetical protein
MIEARVSRELSDEPLQGSREGDGRGIQCIYLHFMCTVSIVVALPGRCEVAQLRRLVRLDSEVNVVDPRKPAW